MLRRVGLALIRSPFVRHVLTISRWIFGPVAVAFLIATGFRVKDAIHAVSLHTQWLPLIITTLLWASLNLLGPIFTLIVLRASGVKISYGTTLSIQLSRLPARYLPGGVWQTVSRMMDLHRLGVDRQRLSALVMMENLLPLAVALTTGGIFILLIGDARYLAIASALGGLTLLAIVPLLLRHRLIRQETRLSLSTYFAAISIIILFWLMAATAFACYWYSFPITHSDAPVLQVYGAYLLAWSAGFASVFAPQGIGVFESAIGLLLKGVLPFGQVAVLAVGFRGATLAADLIAYGAFLAYAHGRKIFR
jgi:hypothetical protein